MTVRPRVKICGITRHEDAQLAVALGADAIGFILWAGSPRAVSAFQARAISKALPPFVTRVGVFVNATPAQIEAEAAMIGLDAAQLHGDEAVDDYAELSLRVLRVAPLKNAEAVDEALALPEWAIPLVEADAGSQRGGSGRTANWAEAGRLASARPIVLAGGLTSDNVGLALRQVRPWAIDVSSGVESAP